MHHIPPLYHTIFSQTWLNWWFVTIPFLLCHEGQNTEASCDAPCGLVPGKIHADTTLVWTHPMTCPPGLTRNHRCEFTRLLIQFRQLIKSDFYNASYLFTLVVFAMKFGNVLWGVPLYFVMLILLEIKRVITPIRLKWGSCKPVWDLTTLKKKSINKCTCLFRIKE